MKLRSRVALFFALGSTLAQPPVVEGQGVYLGVRGGISVTDYSLPYLSEDWRSGIVVGAFSAVPLGARVSLQPELSWVRKGADWFREDIGPTRADLDYAAASVLARLSLPLGGGFSPSVLGGPWVGILSKCGTGDSRGDLNDCELVFGNEEHRTIDVGWDVGVGIAFHSGPLVTQLALRRSRGVSRILRGRADDNPTTQSTQLSLALGYRISGD